MTSVSVALAAWRGARHLEAQLRSLLSQERLPDLVVVSDDGSDDGTAELAEALLAGAPFRWKVVAHGTPHGVAPNFEHAVSHCDGEIVFFCDQDDVWHPPKIRRTLEAMASTPGCGYAFSDARLVDEDLHPLGRSLWSSLGNPSQIRRFGNDASRQLLQLLRRPVVTGAASAFQRILLERLSPVPEGWLHDRWFSLASAALGVAGRSLPEPLFDYRQHPAQQLGGIPDGIGDRLRSVATGNALLEAAGHWHHCAEEIAGRFPQAPGLPAIRRFAAHLLRIHEAKSGGKARLAAAILDELRAGGYRCRNSALAPLRDLFFP